MKEFVPAIRSPLIPKKMGIISLHEPPDLLQISAYPDYSYKSQIEEQGQARLRPNEYGIVHSEQCAVHLDLLNTSP